MNLLQIVHPKQLQPQPQQQKKLKQLNNLLIKMKTLATVTVGMLLFAASGCTSTLSVGPQANKDAVIGGDVSTESASVTLPLVKATLGTAKGGDKK
jgi:hypothetical protein